MSAFESASVLRVVDGRKREVGPAAAVGARDEEGLAHEHLTIGRHTGFSRLEQAIFHCPPGAVIVRDSDGAEETLFVLSGTGWLRAAGRQHELEPEAGVTVGPGVAYELGNAADAPLRLVCVRVPEPEPGALRGAVSVSRLSDQQIASATAAREFRVVADPSSGLQSATHFVGLIPPSRAPDHFHTYDEVIYVIDGTGVMHSGEQRWPLGPGSCIQLPARTVHCLENTGSDTMRVQAVFRPAGSPAAAYYPDGTPAHPAAPPLPDTMASKGGGRP